MKIGIVPINIGATAAPDKLAALARHAESAGVESLWTFEHVIVPVEYESKYPYHPSGKMAASPETPFVDPLIALTFVASQTSTIRLGTGVNILPQANPLLLAKQAASLDYLSGGRLLLGLGVGWLAEEFRAMSVPFERRGVRGNDYLAAMKKVWSGEVVDHESEFLSWHGFKSYPLPVQRPHPPLIIGGNSPAALRRVARFGDGWFAASSKPEDLTRGIAALREETEKAGRDPSRIEITTFWTQAAQGMESVQAYAEAGAARLVAPLATLGDDPSEGIDRLAETVIGKV